MAVNYYPYFMKKDLKGIFKGLTEFLLVFSSSYSTKGKVTPGYV